MATQADAVEASRLPASLETCFAPDMAARNPRDPSNINAIAPTIRARLKAQGASVGEART